MFSIRAVFPSKKESVQLLVRYPPNMQSHFEDILGFWFVEIMPSQWWEKSDTFDQMILQPFQKIMLWRVRVSFLIGVMNLYFW